MTPYIIAIILLLAALSFAAYKLSQTSKKAEVLQNEVNQLSLDKAVAAERLATAEKALIEQQASAEKLLESKLAAAERLRISERESFEQRIAEERAQLSDRFKALAAEILQANSQQLDQRSRTSLETVLAPMRTSLENFTRDFKDCYATEHSDRLSIREGIQQLMELNKRVSDEANRLTHALQGNTRVQGQWGEMVLLNILEHSGLEEGRWFVTQDTCADDGARLRPDAVITCPKDRKIIIDSKVSLSAYLEWLNADTDETRDNCARAHIRSIENHVRQLRDKSYQDHFGANKTDFVLMFMPHEGAYILAMQTAPELWQRAYESRIVIVSPTHLVTVIKLVEQMWQTEDHNVNALRIADETSKMLEKLISMLTDFAKVGDTLGKSQEAYDSAIRKLKEGPGNVVKRIEDIVRLGVRTKKSLPQKLQNPSEEEGIN